MLALGAIFGISSQLGYLLPAIIGLESMGVPSPGETALVLAAVLASQGKLEIGLVIVIAAAWLAGINGMRFRQFFFWNALGGISWAVTYGLVGYFLGNAGARVIERFGIYALGALIVLAIAGYGYVKLRERRSAK
jgi:membrane protein DedA with SNARE-associated domain